MPADNVTRPRPYICLKYKMKTPKCIAKHKHTNAHDIVPLPETYIRVVVKIMVPFWIPVIIRHLILRVPKEGP